MKFEVLSPQSWEMARIFAALWGTIPTSFTTVIRHLMNEHSAGLARTAGLNRNFALRLLKTPSLLAPIRSFCSQYGVARGDLPQYEPSPEELIEMFSPYELAFVFGLVYVTRRAKSLCNSDEWAYLSEPMAYDLDAAVALGRVIPAIGAGTALIEASASSLGKMAFLRNDVKKFTEYRRILKRTGSAYDYDEENARWGCVHSQIASVVLQLLGFGVTRSNALATALTSASESGTSEEVAMIRDFRMARLWRESVMSTGAAPTGAIQSMYYPKKSELEEALESVKNNRMRPAAESWLFQGKDSFEPQEKPSDSP